MLRPTHAEKQFKANRVFTGRTDERNLFAEVLCETDTKDSYKVLNWYGVGGQGKSSLLREFQRMIAKHNDDANGKKPKTRLIPAKVDFEDERLKRIDAALYSLRLQLAQSSGFTFHTFDTAFITYYKKTRPGIDIATAFPELFKGEKEGMMDLLDVLDGPLSIATDLASAALPGANLLYKWGARLTGKLSSWWKSRGNQVLSGIEILQPEQLLEKLPSYLGIDLCNGVAANPKARPVILLDTYEAIWRDRAQKDGLADRRADAWVRLLVQDSPGVLFVIAGRDKLRWGEIDQAWNSVITAHLLDKLSDEDADRFLLGIPIGNDNIRAKIVGSSQGLPFYLDLQVSLYEALKEQSTEPSEERFGGTPSDILARFLEHLSESDQGALRLASYLQVITQEMMERLAEAFLGRAINFTFDQMVSRSSFIEISDGTYEIHTLLKTELQNREQAEHSLRFKKTHQWLFQYYDQKIDRSWDLPFASKQDRIAAINLAVLHLEKSDPEGLVKWGLSLRNSLSLDSSWDTLELVYRRAISNSFPSQQQKPMIWIIKNNLACICYATGRLTEAASILEELNSLSSSKIALEKHLKLKVMHNLASTYFLLDEHEAGTALVKELDSLKPDCSGIDDASLFVIESGIARAYLRRGDFVEAEKLLRPLALEALENAGDDYWIRAYAIQSLAHSLQSQGRFEEAELLSRFALGLFAPANKQTDDPTPHEDGESSKVKDSEVDDSIDLIHDGINSEHLFRTVSLNFLPGVFNEHYRKSLLNPLADDYEYSRFAMKSSDLLVANWSNEYCSIQHHPNSNVIERELLEALSRFDASGRYVPALQRLGVDILIFEGKGLDAYYHFEGNAIIVTAPKDLFRSNAVSFVVFFAAIYSAFMQRGGFRPPDMSFGLSKLASFHHGAMLDTLEKFCQCLGVMDKAGKNIFMECFSDEFVEFCGAVEKGVDRDELYTIYSKIFESLRSEQEYSM